MLQNNLKRYKAKSNNETIYEHNKKLKMVLDNIKDIYNIDDIKYKKLEKCIQYHDIGKCTEYMQESISSKEIRQANVRHELYGASVKDLEFDEKIAILTHHKPLDYFKKYIGNNIYKNELNEVSEKLDVELENIENFIKDLFRKIQLRKQLENIDLILLKGYLMYCDHLASAGVTYIDKNFNAITNFKIPEGFSYNSIQMKVLELKNQVDIMINAMTGLGKTATSMYWSDLVQNDTKSKRIYYILPYTASINSLFNDFQNRELSVSMLHSKAEYFLSKNDNFKNKDIKHLYGLFKRSNKQINICTIYQIIKAAFSCKRFEMLLAQFKNSIFIIDEIHCFDIKELCYTLEFLKFAKEKLGIKICIMSASMPTCLQQLILDKLNINTLIKPDKKDLIKRHSIFRIKKDLINDIDKIEYDLKQGKQVLICVNSVDLSQKLYEYFNKKYKCKVLHGRFNIRDREYIEKDLKSLDLLIGTQAIEVSLDISYDVMYTELAPLDALLQRFGRVNRKGEKGISNIYIYNNTSQYIYEDYILSNTDNVINEISHQDNHIILEEKVNYYLDKVYTHIDMTTYNDLSNKFILMLKTLKVGTENLNATEDMCNNNTIKVLPNILENEYIKYMKSHKYLEANSLLVNISLNKFKNNQDKFCYNEKYNVHITHYEYNNETGLKFI